MGYVGKGMHKQLESCHARIKMTWLEMGKHTQREKQNVRHILHAHNPSPGPICQQSRGGGGAAAAAWLEKLPPLDSSGGWRARRHAHTHTPCRDMLYTGRAQTDSSWHKHDWPWPWKYAGPPVRSAYLLPLPLPKCKLLLAHCTLHTVIRLWASHFFCPASFILILSIAALPYCI